MLKVFSKSCLHTQGTNVQKFWTVFEHLQNIGLIKAGRDFYIKDGHLYVRLMQVHTLYMNEMITRHEVDWLNKSDLEHQLRLETHVFIEYIRKRFPDGSNNWTFKMRYGKIPALPEFESKLQQKYGIDARLFYNAN